MVTFVFLFRQTLGDDLFEAVRHAFNLLRERRRFAFLDSDNLPVNIFTLEWHLSGDHFVEHHTDAPNIGALIDSLAHRLLGRHVTDSSHHEPGFSVDQDSRAGF